MALVTGSKTTEYAALLFACTTWFLSSTLSRNATLPLDRRAACITVTPDSPQISKDPGSSSSAMAAYAASRWGVIVIK